MCSQCCLVTPNRQSFNTLEPLILLFVDGVRQLPLKSQPPKTSITIADLVGETRDVEGRYLKVLVHPELQMTTDVDMDWRVFEYNAGLLLREGQPEARVVTVVQLVKSRLLALRRAEPEKPTR